MRGAAEIGCVAEIPAAITTTGTANWSWPVVGGQIRYRDLGVRTQTTLPSERARPAGYRAALQMAARRLLATSGTSAAQVWAVTREHTANANSGVLAHLAAGPGLRSPKADLPASDPITNHPLRLRLSAAFRVESC